jgi:hypothetical protein
VTIDAAGNVTLSADATVSADLTVSGGLTVSGAVSGVSASDVGALPDSATPADIGALPDSATASDVGALPDSTTPGDIGALALTGGTLTGALDVEGSVRSDAVSVNTQTGTSYTLVASDAGKLVTLDNASGITLTVPPESSVAFSTGATIAVAQLGAGTVTVAGGAGVTVSSLDDATDLADQYATASLVKVGSDNWLLVGALA